MSHTTPQERLALAVIGLLVAAGGAARALAARDREAGWVENAPAAVDTRRSGPPAALRAEVARGVERQARASTPLAPGERVDPSRAPAEELERLPRVGPALAARIVAWRAARGPFRTLADLDSVPGVGAGLLAAIAPHLTLPAQAPPRAPPAGAPPGAAAPLDVNAATAGQLAALPGIGPALAGRIVEWRAARGRFRTVQELEQVPGIGPRLLERLRPHLRVGP